MDQERQELLEIYKLQAELADRVSQRRDGVNRLYVSLSVGLLLFTAPVLRFGLPDEGISTGIVLSSIALFGVAFAMSWFLVIRYYRQVNAAKFIVLQDLERRLAYRFFTNEEKLGLEDKMHSTYWKRSFVMTALPWCWLILFFILTGYSASLW